jgi:DNA-binding response OmpR family regulator
MRRKRILIADDDSSLVQVLTLRCEMLGLEVLTAYDAFSALKLIQDRVPDLVCVDVNMPCGNGLSVCEMMAGDDQLRSIPVLILTGRTDEETVIRCHHLCAFYVLKSPGIWADMQTLIRELLKLDEAPCSPGAQMLAPCYG